MSSKKELSQFVALKIKSLRSESNISQEELIEDTGLNVSLIEMGKTNVTINTILRICQRFDSTMSEFFEGFENNAHQ